MPFSFFVGNIANVEAEAVVHFVIRQNVHDVAVRMIYGETMENPAPYTVIEVAVPRLAHLSVLSQDGDIVLRAYRTALYHALEAKCKSVALPLVPTDSRNPNSLVKARELVLFALRRFLRRLDISVQLVLSDEEKQIIERVGFSLTLPHFDAFSYAEQNLSKNLQKYLDTFWNSDPNAQQYVSDELDIEALEEHICSEKFESFQENRVFACLSRELDSGIKFSYDKPASAFLDSEEIPQELRKKLANLAPSFSALLLGFIVSQGKQDCEVYRKANLDRRHFSKIRKNTEYQPSKGTVLALALALELTFEESERILASAGYAFSASSKRDVIVSYYILHEQYDIFSVNEALFAHGEKILP